MKPYRVYTLRLWLPLLVLGIFSLLLLALAFYLYYIFDKQITDHHLSQVKQEMGFLQRQLEEELYEKRYIAANQALTSMGVNSKIIFLAALDEDGRIIFSTRSAWTDKLATEVSSNFDLSRFARLKQTKQVDITLSSNEKTITAYYPLTFSTHPDSLRLHHIGGLVAVYDLSGLHTAIINDVLSSAAVVWLLSLIGILLILGFLSIFFNKPLEHLVDITRRVTKGELGIKNRLTGSGIIMQLGNSFDEMSIELEKNQNTLISIAEGISNAGGETFFESIAQHLTEALNADYVIIGKLLTDNIDRVQTLAVCTDDKIISNFEYDLENTPCEIVIKKSRCSFQDSVQQQFPKDHMLIEMNVEAYVGICLHNSSGRPFGVIKVLFRKQIDNLAYVEKILNIFATRVSVELERAQTVQELLDSETRLLNAQRIARLGFWEWDIPTHKIFWSDEIYKIFGFENNIEITYDRFIESVHPEDRENLENSLKLSVKNIAPYVLDHRIILPNGEIRYVHEQGEIKCDENGAPFLMVGTVIDITERTKIEKELALHHEQLELMVDERTQQLHNAQQELIKKERLATLGQLTATVSHELRNPLSAMVPSLYIIQKLADLDKPKLKEAISRIERNIQRCDQIIDEMLDFTRITELDRQPRQIDDWLMMTLDEQDIPEGITLKCTLGLPELSLPFDTDRLRRAIINVYDNACHAMCDELHPNQIKDGATLSVVTQKANERIQIIISDNGPGIPEDILEKVFEPLFSTKNFGVGLGMSTVKQIMDQHGGGIKIDTEPGHGTRIILWLPLQHKNVEATIW